MFKSLSGRFLILTVIFVMIAEVLIFVPSVARFRVDYLSDRLERAQIASLALLAEEQISPNLEQELLTNAGVYNVVLRRDEMRQLILASPIIQPIYQTYDLRNATAWELIMDALACLLDTEDRIMRVIGEPSQEAGLLIEITMPTQGLRNAMIDYGLRILAISAVISAITASLLFVAVNRLMVRPIKGVVDAMSAYAKAPEDARKIIKPGSDITELRAAEDALKSLQTELTGNLRQKERLAQLGGAVAKISHDMRNILTSAQLFSDRMEMSEDPTVQRLAPKLVGSITRAVNLCETTLSFGRAEEPAPQLMSVSLTTIIRDVVEGERIACGESDVSFAEDVPEGLHVTADPEQLYRVLSNLIRNARQAIVATSAPGEISVQAREDSEGWTITVNDTGPGLPPKAQEHLFTAFQGGARKGGSGLGLAISAELVRGHGGRLDLLDTGPAGTSFRISLPKADLELAAS